MMKRHNVQNVNKTWEIQWVLVDEECENNGGKVA